MCKLSAKTILKNYDLNSEETFSVIKLCNFLTIIIYTNMKHHHKKLSFIKWLCPSKTVNNFYRIYEQNDSVIFVVSAMLTNL